MRAGVLGLSLAVLGMGAPPAWGLDPGRDIRQYDARLFGVRDGLPQASVKALAQTPDGYLWVGTLGGLARFDGHRFTLFRAEDTPALRIHRVFALRVDHTGDLWIGTAGGTGVIRYRAGRFETFEDLIGHRGNAMFDMVEDRQGAYWFAAGGGVLKLQAGAFTTLRSFGDVPIAGSATSVAVTADGTLLVGTLSGLLTWKDGHGRRIGAADGLTDLPVGALLVEPSGRLWIGTDGAGLFVSDGAGFRRVPISGDRGQIEVSDLLRDRDGNLWVATRAGLGRLRDGVVELAAAGSLAAEEAGALLEDSDGNLWVGTRGAGLLRLGEGAFTSVPGEAFAGRAGIAVTGTPDGAVWVGTAGAGLVRVAQGRATRLTTDDAGVCTNFVWAVMTDAGGGVWMGGDHGPRANLCRLDPRTGQVRGFGQEEGLGGEGVRVIAELPGGELWVGTAWGLYRRERAGTRFSPVVLPDVRGQFETYDIHQARDGTLWLAAANRLYRRDRDGWRWFDARDGLSNGQVFSIREDAQGTLWLGTLDGFTRVRGGRLTAWKHRHGFRSGPVYQALPDGAGDLWLCTPEGVLRVPAREVAGDPEGDRVLAFTRFGAEDGMGSDVCEGGMSGSSAWRSPGGVLWFVTGRGAASVDPGRMPPSPPAPRAIIEQVAFDGGRVEVAPSLRLPPGHGDLRVAYTAPRLLHAEGLRFRYRLQPFDARWIDAGDRREAFYTNVPPGPYRFEVATGSDDGTWSAAPPATLALVLAPHFHQTWWFRVLLMIAAAGVLAAVILAVHARRIQALEARHQAVLAERTRIGRDLHDTLAQGFTGISVQLEAATARLPPGSERAREKMDRARALVRVSLADARRAVWDLRAPAGETGGLVAALSGIARSLSADVPVRVQVDGVPRTLPAAVETTVLRIGQEALTNAVRHAGATSVTLAISFVADGVKLEISDDGRGFDAGEQPEAPGHFGLAGLRERAREIQADLRVESRPGAGTRIVLVAPVAPPEGPS